MTTTWFNQSAAANRRPTEQSGGSGNLSATVAADRAFPVVVAGLGRLALGPKLRLGMRESSNPTRQRGRASLDFLREIGTQKTLWSLRCYWRSSV